MHLVQHMSLASAFRFGFLNANTVNGLLMANPIDRSEGCSRLDSMVVVGERDVKDDSNSVSCVR